MLDKPGEDGREARVKGAGVDLMGKLPHNGGAALGSVARWIIGVLSGIKMAGNNLYEISATLEAGQTVCYGQEASR